MSQYFTLFQLEPQFDIDTDSLEQNYRTLAARFHPDRFASASAFEQKQAVMMSSTVNEAYRTLKNPTDRAAAQALLNTLGWVAASEGTDLYVNLPVDCMINVATPALRCTVDQICEMGRVKYRLSGFPAHGSALRLHLRLPAGVEPDQVFLNGRRLLAPQIERGYLVVDRAWRNNEELYYDLPERKQLFGE